MTKERLKALLAEYGYLAAVVYFSLFFLTWAGFAFAIHFGFDVESAKGGASLLGASWLATKLTQPIRIAATLGLTPIVAGVVRKVRGKPVAVSNGPADAPKAE